MSEATPGHVVRGQCAQAILGQGCRQTRAAGVTGPERDSADTSKEGQGMNCLQGKGQPFGDGEGRAEARSHRVAGSE